jgi:hypothetical protein
MHWDWRLLSALHLRFRPGLVFIHTVALSSAHPEDRIALTKVCRSQFSDRPRRCTTSQLCYLASF